ncbi:probable sugar phosphate/phosphate translocator At3g11320 [Hibiscus syriacus]|uniref:probable sugar phosphate/phosphate translocator At3g11320 n=1 Tax=Hibiscus syriacus TaxID=106335 RepID=UPI0019250F0A|nr:probable sugar phosphate/phosphate translocator At3g11320 [Hibiscus syriacus]
MNLLLFMAPIAVVFLLPATLIMEENVVGTTVALARDDVNIVWYLIFNSALAYFVNLTNFLVTKHTSALTLQVLGNGKGAVAVVVSILFFKNPISVTGLLGYTLTVSGVILYGEAKKRNKISPENPGKRKKLSNWSFTDLSVTNISNIDFLMRKTS